MLEEQRNYSAFESFDDYCRYVAYACRKLPESSVMFSTLINWHSIGYSYRRQIMNPRSRHGW